MSFMSFNVANTSGATSNLPTAEEVKGWSRNDVRRFLEVKRYELDLEDEDINKIYIQKVKGSTFLDFTAVDFERWGIPGSPAKEIEKLINEIKGAERSTKKKGDPSFRDILEVVTSLKQNVTSNPGSSTDAQESDLQDIIKSNKGNLAVIGESALYVRQAYKDLYLLVTDPEPDPKFIITGTSGVGKSCFLLYLLIQLLYNYDNATVIFQPREGKTCYCFKGSKLETGEIDDFSDDLYSPKTWYLADSIRPSLDPKSPNSARTIVAASPNSLNNSEFQDFAKDVVNKYYMPPWTIEELKVCQKHIFKQVPEGIMLEMFDRVGGVPRYVLRQPERVIKKHQDTNNNEIWDKIVNKSMERIEEAISEVKSVDDLILCFTENANYVKVSNRIIHRWPDPSYEDYYFEWASTYIYELIMRKLDKFRWDELLKKIKNPADITNSRGIMFELYAIHDFQSFKDEKFGYEMRCLEENDNRKIRLRIRIQNVQYVRTAEQLSRYNVDNVTVRPSVKNFGAVDLFIMPNYMFQFTVSQNHPIKQKELVKIIPHMLAYKRDGNAKIRLVFVVPDDVYDGFKLQRYVTPKKNDDDLADFMDVERLSPFLNNVEQWVLKIDLSMRLQGES